MDLTKELEIIEKESFAHESILNKFNEEKYQLEKKSYIIQVLKIARDVDNYIMLKNFSLCNIGGIELDCSEDDYNKTNSISLNFQRCDGEFIPHDEMTKKYPEILQRFREIFNGNEFKSLKDLSVKSEFLNEEFITDGKEIDLIEGAGEQLIDTLLSKELKTILDYNRMQLSLDNKQKGGKKLKV